MSGLFSLARPLLRALDPERAHGLALAALRALPLPAAAVDPPELATRAFGLDFPNPLGIAAGFDKNGEAVDGLLAAGFGFVEVGTVTPLPQPGNPRPRLFRLERDRAAINRFGFNNAGHAGMRAQLAHRRRRGILGVNVGANKDAADRIADYVAGVGAFAPLADYFTINVSSPNTPGLRDLQRREALDDLLARVIEAREAAPARRPVLLKIAPDLDDAGLDDVVAVAAARGVDGMIVSNTTIARAGLTDARAGEAGGLSGRPLFTPATRILARAFLRVEGRFPLIGVGGIDGPQTAIAKIEAGASLLQIYTALIFEGPALVGRIKRGLGARLAAERLTGLAPLVGRRAVDYAA